MTTATPPSDEIDSPRTARELLPNRISLPSAVVDRGCEVLDVLLGEPWTIDPATLGDTVQRWRWKNRVVLAFRARELLASSGTGAHSIPTWFLAPLVDAAGDVSDPDLLDCWARLLCAGVKDEKLRQPTYQRILRALSPEDARTFRDWCVEFEERTIDVELDRDPVLQRLVALQLMELPAGVLPLATDGRVYHPLQLSLIGRQLRDALFAV